MTKVLLISESPSNKELYANVLPPMGILYIASYLEKNGIPADVSDNNIKNKKSPDYISYDIIGFSLNSSNQTNTIKKIIKIRKLNKNIKIIIGGPLASAVPEYLIRNYPVNAVIEGEGEKPIIDYIKNPDNIMEKGIYYKKNNEIYYSGKNINDFEIDSLPFPALSKVPVDKYNVLLSRTHPVSSIITSRGCPYKCVYCFKYSGSKWRARTPENVVEEIEWQIKKFNIKELCIFDDNFTYDIERSKKICRLIIKNKLNIYFQLTNGIRMDRVDLELLKLFKQANFWKIDFAVETGSRYIMEKINKKMDFKNIRQTISWCKKLGIYTHIYFMLGFPWETKKMVFQTINYAKRINSDLTQFSEVIPFPGTPLYDEYIGKNNNSLVMEETSFYSSNKRYYIGKIDHDELKKYFKTAYSETMYRFDKILGIIRNISLKSFLKLVLYAFRIRKI